MLPVPEITNIDVAFGNIKHLPKYESLPDEFRRMNDPHCRAVSMWFYNGAEAHPGGIKIDGVAYKARDGIKPGHALGAIKAALGSFEPKHEHKIAGCGYLLREWFEIDQSAALKTAQS